MRYVCNQKYLNRDVKITNEKTRRMCKIYSKLTIKTPEWRHWRLTDVFITIFKKVSHIILVFLLLADNNTINHKSTQEKACNHSTRKLTAITFYNYNNFWGPLKGNIFQKVLFSEQFLKERIVREHSILLALSKVFCSKTCKYSNSGLVLNNKNATYLYHNWHRPLCPLPSFHYSLSIFSRARVGKFETFWFSVYLGSIYFLFCG